VYSDHGRGLYLIKQLMDDVRFERGGSEIHMVLKQALLSRRIRLARPAGLSPRKGRPIMSLSSLVLVLASAAIASADPVTKAVAVLTPTHGQDAAGKVVFTKVEDGVRVSVNLAGLKEGAHGFHIHEFGDCSAPDFSSAGGHFNPAGSLHAGPREPVRHAGDLGNVEAAADGKATLEFMDAHLSLEGSTGIVGRSVIVHVNADDLKTQPTGNAGGRLACGVVGIAQPETEG
ncbi:MAG: superoxide dismutase family protein, partial [Candidatus Rokuibacteriota bacterium]